MTETMKNHQCSGDDCGETMFESADFYLCPACDMITPEEIEERLALKDGDDATA